LRLGTDGSMNQHCANCINTLLFRITTSHKDAVVIHSVDCVCVSDCRVWVLIFDFLDLHTSVLVRMHIFIISRPTSSMKVMHSSSRSYKCQLNTYTWWSGFSTVQLGNRSGFPLISKMKFPDFS